MHKQPLLVSEDLRSVTGGTSLSCLFHFLHAIHSWLWAQWAHSLSQCSCSTVLKIKGPEKVFEAKHCQMWEQGCTGVLLNGLFCVFSTLHRQEWRIYRSVVCCVLMSVPTTLIKTIKPNWAKWLIITLQLTELVTTAPSSSSMKEPRASEQPCFCSLGQAFQTSEAWNSSTLHEWLQQQPTIGHSQAHLCTDLLFHISLIHCFAVLDTLRIHEFHDGKTLLKS